MHVHLLNLWRRSNSFNLILQLIWCHSFAAWLTTFVKEWGVSKSLTLVQQQQKVSAILSSLLWVSVLQRQIHVLWSLPIKISHKSGAKLSSIIIMAVVCLMYMTQSIYHLHEHSHTNNWTLYSHVSLLSHIFIDQGVSLLIFFLLLFFKSFISMFLKLVKSIRYMRTHTGMLVHGKVGSQNRALATKVKDVLFDTTWCSKLPPSWPRHPQLLTQSSPQNLLLTISSRLLLYGGVL